MVRPEVAGARIARATVWLDDAGSGFDVLADRGAIDRGLADRLRQAAGLRNRIAHGYAMLDYARVQAEALEGIPGLRRFLAAVAREAGI